MDTQTTPSGIPYLAYLSGLNLGQGGMSGAMDPSLAGGGAQQAAGPGMTGGLSLSELQQLLMQQQGDTGAGAPGVTAGQLLQGIGGTVGQGTLAGGGGAIAGSPQAGAGQAGTGYTAGQSTTGGIDPLAIIKQALGLGAKAAGALGSQSGTPGSTSGGYTAGDTSAQQGQISPTGYSLTGAGAPAAGSPEGLSQYFSGQFAGTNLLQDPTLGPLMTQGLLEGSITPSDLANFATLGGDQLAGLRTALATGNVQSDLGTQLLSGTGGTGGYTLGGNTNLDLSGATGGAGGYGLGNVASGLGGLQGLLGLVQGAQSGSPVGILQGLQGAYGGITGALGVSPISELIAQYAPQLGSALVGAIGTGGAAGAGAGAAATAPAISAALSGIGGAAAPVIAGIVAYIGALEEKKAREAGYANNPIAGGLYSAATQGVGQDVGLLNQIKQAGGFSQVPTDQLEQMLPQLVNQLGPYFATAQGPKGPVRASDALTGMFGRAGLGGTEQYTANEQQAQQGVMDLVSELMGRGVTYEQLGQLPVSNAFSNLTMDMYNPLRDLYAANKGQYDTSAQPMLQGITQANRQMLDPQEAMRMAAAGQNPATFGYTQDASGNWYSQPRIATGNPNGDLFNLQPGQLTPDLLFNAAQGAGYFGAPDSATKAGGLTSAMYGGPLWEAIARMSSPTWGANVQPGSLQAMIQQHFNPWAVVGGLNPQQLTASLQPILQSMVASGDTGAATGTGPGGASGEGY